MKGAATRTAIVMVCLVLAGGATAWADRPECPPTKPGACFRDIGPGGLFVFILDSDGELLVMGPMDREEDFELVHPGHDGFDVVQINRDTGFFYCSLVDLSSFPPPCIGEELNGTGHVSAHVHLTDDFRPGCPSSAHVHGKVDGRRVTGSFMVVGKRSCRLHRSELELEE